MIPIIVLSSLLFLSIIANVVLSVLLRKKPTKQDDRTASELLHDLTAYGNALVRIERIAPANVLLRSPRQ